MKVELQGVLTCVCGEKTRFEKGKGDTVITCHYCTRKVKLTPFMSTSGDIELVMKDICESKVSMARQRSKDLEDGLATFLDMLDSPDYDMGELVEEHAKNAKKLLGRDRS